MPLDAPLFIDLIVGGFCAVLSLYLTYGLLLAAVGAENGVMRASAVIFAALTLMGLWLMLSPFLPADIGYLWKAANFTILLVAEAFLIRSLKRGN